MSLTRHRIADRILESFLDKSPFNKDELTQRGDFSFFTLEQLGNPEAFLPKARLFGLKNDVLSQAFMQAKKILMQCVWSELSQITATFQQTTDGDQGDKKLGAYLLSVKKLMEKASQTNKSIEDRFESKYHFEMYSRVAHAIEAVRIFCQQTPAMLFEQFNADIIEEERDSFSSDDVSGSLSEEENLDVAMTTGNSSISSASLSPNSPSSSVKRLSTTSSQEKGASVAAMVSFPPSPSPSRSLSKRSSSPDTIELGSSSLRSSHGEIYQELSNQRPRSKSLTLADPSIQQNVKRRNSAPVSSALYLNHLPDFAELALGDESDNYLQKWRSPIAKLPLRARSNSFSGAFNNGMPTGFELDVRERRASDFADYRRGDLKNDELNELVLEENSVSLSAPSSKAPSMRSK